MLARSSPTPLYRQLKERLVRDMESGILQAHGQLPSERDWVKSLGVSRITVRQALSDLVSLGYVYSVPGKGFFVADRKQQARALDAFLSFSAAAIARAEVPSSRVLEASLLRATADEARSLGVSQGVEVLRIRRLRLSNDVPMMIQQSVLPHALCPGLLDQDLTRASLFELLRDTYNLKLDRADTVIGARLADKIERKLLDLGDDGVVLLVDQVSFTAGGAPVEHSLSIMHPERHPLHLSQNR